MMMTPLWFVSLAALLVLDLRTGAEQQKDLASHRCFSCASNETSCDAHAQVECPADSPYCATTAVAPHLTSFLSCSAATKTPCSLTQTFDEVFKLTCVCTENLCNAPFSADIQKQLLKFTSSNFTNNATDYTEAFFTFANVTEKDVFKSDANVQTSTLVTPAVTVKTTVVSSSVHAMIAHPVDVIGPRAEALKGDSTAPSDDDEDESEGSGSYEETRQQRQPAAAPANPSSYLPAENNKAPHILPTLLTVPPILYFVV